MFNMEKQNPEPTVKITGFQRVTEDDIKKALKLVPRSRMDQIIWEENGSPRKRTKKELEKVKKLLSEYSEKHLNPRKVDFKNNSAFKNIYNNILCAKHHEEIEYFFQAAHFYNEAAQEIIQSRDLSPRNLEWAAAMNSEARRCYDRWNSIGYGDDGFTEVGPGIYYTKERIDGIKKLSSEIIKEVNEAVDLHISKYQGDLKTQGALRDIEYYEFMALLNARMHPANEYNNVASLLIFGAESALESGSIAWAKELVDLARNAYSKYTQWQRMEGIEEDTQSSMSLSKDPRLHDHWLVYSRLKKISEQLKNANKSSP